MGLNTRLIGINRFRMGTDGHGITTLVGFHGCPLRCRYCLNSQCLDANAKTTIMTPEELIKQLRKDELYYVATKGGVTFGGGEPLLHSTFIKEVLELGAKDWNVSVETSLNVPWQNVEGLVPYVNEYIVDIKDMNPVTYKQYTGKDNLFVLENLRRLIRHGITQKILCRIPLIDGYNDIEAQKKSKEELVKMGIERFDLFTYKTE